MGNKELAIRPLTARQKAFVREYVLLNDGTKAAIKAGYSKGRASDEARELLQHPAIKRELGKARAHLAKQYKSQLDLAIGRLVSCITRVGSDYVDEQGRPIPLHQLSQRANEAVDGIEVTQFEDKAGNVHTKTKLKLMPLSSGLDMAFKIQGSYAPDKHQVVTANVDLSDLYDRPENVLDEDVIELEPESDTQDE